MLFFDKLSDMNDVHVTVDTSVDKSLIVHIGTDTKFNSVPCSDGLYYLDPGKLNKNKTKQSISSYCDPNLSSISNNNRVCKNLNIERKQISLLSTVENNKKIYTKIQVSKADTARKL